MKPLKLLTIFFVSSSLTLNAYDLSKVQKTPLVCDINTTLKTPVPTKVKGNESTYDKLERKLSEYKGSWFKDMMIYSADIFIPDEMTRAVKDVMENRQNVGFGDQTEKVPKTIANDSYNVALTTAYYYMQDMARITERVWKNQACNPDHFEYDIDSEPKVPLLYLTECHSMSRGVTENGIVLPQNKNFPNAFYPYAAKPDGCSAEGLQDLYDQSNDILDDARWLENVCNTHDECYYTEGTTAKECNSKFIVEMVDACNKIKAEDTVKYLGIKNTFCGFKALLVATGANACARRYFAHAQKVQRTYNLWVQRYEKIYKEAKENQNFQEKGQ